MMSNNLSVNILISFLKHYGVKHLVLSPGMRNIPFVTAVERDPYFVCHSVVDERNAAFYAMGIAQVLNTPVGIACTSGTAVSNYLTGLTEAHNSRTSVVAITCDRSPYVLDQLETQKIDQVAALSSVVKYCANLPQLKDRDDVWYFERVLSEAFLALRSSSPGPIHINLPLVGDTNRMWSDDTSKEVCENIKFIDCVKSNDNGGWADKLAQLAASKRVMLIVGQNFPGNGRLSSSLTKFCARFKCPAVADNLSNFRCPQFIPAEAVMKGLSAETIQRYLPEIVITLGMNFQERIKDLFKDNERMSVHWGIDSCGRVHDCFKSQTVVFECEDFEFLERMLGATEVVGSENYLSQWKKLSEAAVIPDVPYGNALSIFELSRNLPSGSLLHVSILNAVRLSQFFVLPESVKVYANVSSFGIDGCLPTFVGQSAVSDGPTFLVIGDISFFYSMNALAIKSMSKNVHVFLVNNGGAAEFHIPPSSALIPTIDNHIGVAHSLTAKSWAETLGFEYMSAHDVESLKSGMKCFVRPNNERPILFEVFTRMSDDGENTLQLYRSIENNMRNAGVIQ